MVNPDISPGRPPALSRRDFLKLVGAAAAITVLDACAPAASGAVEVPVTGGGAPIAMPSRTEIPTLTPTATATATATEAPKATATATASPTLTETPKPTPTEAPKSVTIPENLFPKDGVFFGESGSKSGKVGLIMGRTTDNHYFYWALYEAPEGQDLFKIDFTGSDGVYNQIPTATAGLSEIVRARLGVVTLTFSHGQLHAHLSRQTSVSSTIDDREFDLQLSLSPARGTEGTITAFNSLAPHIIQRGPWADFLIKDILNKGHISLR